MEVRTIEAKARPKTGKGVARRLRQHEMVPAICYGRGRAPQPVAVSPSDLTKALDPARGWNTVLKLKITDEGKSTEELVLVKDYQLHPVKRSFLHFDFVAVREDEPVQVEVPIALQGKPEGVKDGGILQQLYRKLLVEALPFSIPDKIDVDVTHLKLGQALHISDLTLPAGVKIAIDPRTTICNVVAPKEEKAAAEEVPAEAAAEGAAAPAVAAPAAAGAAAPAKAAAAPAAAKKDAKK
jgi:large subunit ribosomal protein L25